MPNEVVLVLVRVPALHAAVPDGIPVRVVLPFAEPQDPLTEVMRAR
jgi:hypothetical protein